MSADYATPLAGRTRIGWIWLWLAAFSLFAAVIPDTAAAGGAVRVRGYYRTDGTYVQPHYRSAPDGNFWNNWSTKGNVNPYTGKPGTRVTPPSRTTTGSSYLPSYSFPSYGLPSYSLPIRSQSIGEFLEDARWRRVQELRAPGVAVNASRVANPGDWSHDAPEKITIDKRGDAHWRAASVCTPAFTTTAASKGCAAHDAYCCFVSAWEYLQWACPNRSKATELYEAGCQLGYTAACHNHQIVAWGLDDGLLIRP